MHIDLQTVLATSSIEGRDHEAILRERLERYREAKLLSRGDGAREGSVLSFRGKLYELELPPRHWAMLTYMIQHEGYTRAGLANYLAKPNKPPAFWADEFTDLNSALVDQGFPVVFENPRA